MLKLILTLIFFHLSSHKQVTKKVYLNVLSSQPHSYYLGKFGVGIGEGNINVEFYKHDNTHEKLPVYDNLKIGLLMDEEYQKFMETQQCVNRQKLFKQIYELTWVDSVKGQKYFKIKQTVRQHLWYFYVYDCDFQTLETNSKLIVEMNMLNNDSHISSNEQLLPIYLFLLLSWIGILIFLRQKIFSQVQDDQMYKFFISTSFILIGIAYLFRVIELLFFLEFGTDVFFLRAFYAVIRFLTQVIIATIIISIGWGWTLVHLKHDRTYIPIGIICTLLNLATLIIQNNLEQTDFSHHQYDTSSGRVILALRIIIWFIFVLGVCRSLTQSVGKIRQFLKQFYFFGSIYILAWPFAVAFCELFLPLYYHHEAITGIQEGFHLIALSLGCYSFGAKNSSYQSIIKREEAIPFQND